MITPGEKRLFDFIQEELRKRIDLRDRLKKIETIGGADISFRGEEAQVCICVLDFRSLRLIERKNYRVCIKFPYIPGYLSFREGPAILEGIFNLRTSCDCFIFDGNGILHPKNLGLATFLGIILRKPTIGCAKSLLLGEYKSPGKIRGNFSYIKYKKKILGAAVRTNSQVREVYVSCGWGISLKRAIEVVLATSKYRIPEPLRLAHLYSKF